MIRDLIVKIALVFLISVGLAFPVSALTIQKCTNQSTDLIAKNNRRPLPQRDDEKAKKKNKDQSEAEKEKKKEDGEKKGPKRKK